MFTGDVRECFCAGGIDGGTTPPRLRSLAGGDLGRLRGGGGVGRLETFGLTDLEWLPLGVVSGTPGSACELRGGDRICGGLSGGSRMPLLRGGDSRGLR